MKNKSHHKRPPKNLNQRHVFSLKCRSVSLLSFATLQYTLKVLKSFLPHLSYQKEQKNTLFLEGILRYQPAEMLR
jgi:hypothetical protein